MSLNKFMGIGNLGRDPETRYLSNGNAVTNIAIAITEKYKDKDGQQKELTEWVNVAFFGKLAEIASQYLHKGQQVYIEGKLKTDKYEKDGQTRYSTKIIAEKMQMLGGKEHSKSDKPKPAKPEGGFSDMADDIPF